MSDDQSKRSVSDISHLFLSNVRDLHGSGQPKPRRTPPGAPLSEPREIPAAAEQPSLRSIDLTPEEYAQVFASKSDSRAEPEPASRAMEAADAAPVTAVLAGHLNDRQFDRVRGYARHLSASAGQRVGLIDLDVNAFRLHCFDPAVEPGAEIDPKPAPVTGVCDPSDIAEAIEELNVDVDRWLLLLPNARTPEAKELLRHAEHWALVTTCDHDGVVASYRTLKSVADARHIADARGSATRLSIAVLDAAGDAEAVRVQQKLAGVCRQFLEWDLEAEPAVRHAAGVAEHPLMNCRVSRDKAQLASAPHWEVVAALLSRPRRGVTTGSSTIATQAAPAMNIPATDATATSAPPATLSEPAAARAASIPVAAPSVSTPAVADESVRRVSFAEDPSVPPAATPSIATSASAPATAPAAAAPDVATPSLRMTPAASAFSMPSFPLTPAADEVIELPLDASGAAGVLSAFLRRPDAALVECPILPPGCSAAVRLAVTRDGRLALVAAVARGLTDLASIGRAYQWMNENRALLAMAMPQLAIDGRRDPLLHLLVDQADIAGDILRPMLQSDHVVARAYRTLRWAGRTGMLLDAA